MTKHAKKITVIVCLLLAAITPALQGAQPKYNRVLTPNAWFEAAKAGNRKELARLYNKYNIRFGTQCNIHPKYGFSGTALHWSAYEGHLDCVKWLVAQGADIHHKKTDNRTLLHMSAEKGHIEVVKYLVIQGVDIQAKNGQGYGKTALLLAREKDHKEVVQLLENPIKYITGYFKEEMQKQKIAFQTRERELEATLKAEYQDTMRRQQTAFETCERESKRKQEQSAEKINMLQTTIEKLTKREEIFKQREKDLLENFTRREQELQATIEKLTQNEGVLNPENETPYH